MQITRNIEHNPVSNRNSVNDELLSSLPFLLKLAQITSILLLSNVLL